MGFETLEQALRREAQAFVYPPAPALAGRVRAQLEAERAQPQRATPSRAAPSRPAALRPVFIALLTVVVAVTALLALSPDARLAADQLLRRLQIIWLEPTPLPTAALGTPTPGPSSTPRLTATPTGTFWISGRTTLVEARQRARFILRLPAYPPDLGEPDEVYLQRVFDGGQQLILVYYAGPGTPVGEDNKLFSLYQIFSTGLIKKLIHEDPTVVEEVEVNGNPAVWFTGAAHWLQLEGPRGMEEYPVRLVEGNTLVWEIGLVTYRLETMLSKEEAIRIAKSLQTPPFTSSPAAATPSSMTPPRPPPTALPMIPVTATPMP
jgi:hypothetical protein